MSKPIIVKSRGGYCRFALYSGAMVETTRGDNTITRHELARAIKAAQSLPPQRRVVDATYISSTGTAQPGSTLRIFENGRLSIGCKRFLKKESLIIKKWALQAK